MINLPLTFHFTIEESEIVKILISDSSFFSYQVEGAQDLNDEIEQFFINYSRGLFYSLPLRRNFSPFTYRIFSKLENISFGQLVTYKQLANLCDSKGYRAVGNCLNKNPFPLVIPCHRVLSSNGDVGGFAFGKRVKEKILSYEAYICDSCSSTS